METEHRRRAGVVGGGDGGCDSVEAESPRALGRWGGGMKARHSYGTPKQTSTSKSHSSKPFIL